MKNNLIIFLFFSVIFYTGYPQNNHNYDVYTYYNVKDTINATKKQPQKIPVFELVDTQLMDSVTTYLTEIKNNGYDKIEENGVYIRINLYYAPDDSTSIYVGIKSLLNYFLNFNLSTDAYMWRNAFLPVGYKKYLYGCIVIDDFIVIIDTEEYIREQELLRFFSPTDKFVEIHLFDGPEKKTDNFIPSKYFSIHLVSQTNYVSPIPQTEDN